MFQSYFVSSECGPRHVQGHAAQVWDIVATAAPAKSHLARARTVRPWMIQDRMAESLQRIFCCFPQQIGQPATALHRLAMATRLPVASARDTAD